MLGFSRMSPFSVQQESPKKGIGTATGLSNSSQQQHLFESPLPGSGGMFTASPEHHQGYLSSSGSSAYLPNYLLGGTASPSATGQYSKPHIGHSVQSAHSEMSQRFSSSQLSLSEQKSSRKRFSPLLQHSIREKSSNGPPVEGLFDHERNSIDEIYTASSWNSVTPSRSLSTNSTQRLMTPGSSIYDADASVNSSVFKPRSDMMLQSPAQIDPFYTQGENLSTTDILDETWVTVFGFPPSLVGYILEEFSHYGSIMRKETMNNVNWLHVQYQTKIQAKKALSKNGKVLNGNIMIGVMQCIDKEIMMGDKPDVGLNRSVIGPPSVRKTPSTTTPKQSAIRPLSAAYHAAASQTKIVQEGKGTPQRNNSMISRAMEYVFGL